jgi:hypothetical protein
MAFSNPQWPERAHGGRTTVIAAKYLVGVFFFRYVDVDV